MFQIRTILSLFSIRKYAHVKQMNYIALPHIIKNCLSKHKSKVKTTENKQTVNPPLSNNQTTYHIATIIRSPLPLYPCAGLRNLLSYPTA